MDRGHRVQLHVHGRKCVRRLIRLRIHWSGQQLFHYYCRVPHHGRYFFGNIILNSSSMLCIGCIKIGSLEEVSNGSVDIDGIFPHFDRADATSSVSVHVAPCWSLITSSSILRVNKVSRDFWVTLHCGILVAHLPNNHVTTICGSRYIRISRWYGVSFFYKLEIIPTAISNEHHCSERWK